MFTCGRYFVNTRPIRWFADEVPLVRFGRIGDMSRATGHWRFSISLRREWFSYGWFYRYGSRYDIRLTFCGVSARFYTP